MKKTILFSALSMFSFFLNAQTDEECNETKTYGNGEYVGCLNYQDEPDGFGVYTWDDGSYYAGEWEEGEPYGQGVRVYSDGGSYDGQWKEDEKDGRGFYTWTDGGYYDGEWKENEKDGRGVRVYSDGGSYDGLWKENEKDGRGILKNSKDKVVYDGEWKEDEPDGFGVYTWTNGNSYDGEWKEGEFHGQGLFVSADGSSYDGEWKEDKKDGKGTSYLEDGEIIEQVYNKGELELFSEKSNVRNYNVKKDIEGSEEGSVVVSLEKEKNSFKVGLTFGKKGGSFTENYNATFDTGAEMFSIGYRLFRELKKRGLDYDDLKIIKNAVGVSGFPLPNMLIKIKTLKIGGYEVKNIVAWVETSERANSSLLGIGFFNKFSEVKWSLKQETLELFR